MFSTNSSAYKLFNENNLDFMKRLPDSSIDLILTDPPYNLSQFARGNIHLNNGKTINNKIAEWDSIPLNPNDYIEPFTRIIKPTGNPRGIYSYSLVIHYLANGMMHLTRYSQHSRYSFGIRQLPHKVYTTTVF